MPTEIIMPKVDMVMETGTFVEWLKKEGQEVKKGEALFVIMTDKAAIECESPASGVLAGVSARPDDVIPVTNVIGYILSPGEASPIPAADRPSLLPVASQEASQTVTASPSKTGIPISAAEGSEQLLRATPLARQVARELGVELSAIKGSGPRGRIYKSDVLAAREKAAKSITQAPPGFTQTVAPAHPAGGTELAIQLPNAAIRERVPVKGARAVIARRMAYSAATAPHIYLGINVDMTEVIRWRQKAGPKIEERLNLRLSYTAILAYVVAHVLPGHPYLNSSLADNEIILWEDVHLGIATALGEDLIVPVIRQAQNLTLEDTVKEMNRLLEAARAQKLLPAEMSGSTFTISNLGMYGVEDFTAIINPPEAAILAVAKMVDTAVAVDGELVIRPIIHFTVGADHRINDGVRAARFLDDLKETLENPYLLF
jgi:pyruvate dehydrogenase E2 component (dihydrolipoamide acetyltransferase)